MSESPLDVAAPLEKDNELSTAPSNGATARSPMQMFPLLLLATAAVVILTLVAFDAAGRCPWRNVCGQLLADDIGQGRLDTALPAPQADFYIEQTFTPRHNGLAEIELLLVRYGGAPTVEDDSTFTLELWDADTLVAAQMLAGRELSHNQPYTLRFQPEPDSAGRLYQLRLRGSDDNHLSAWGYSLDVHDGGELRTVSGPLLDTAPETTAQELRFTTRYALSWRETGSIVAASVSDEGLLILATLLFLPLPGCLLLLIARPRWDAAAWLGAAFALGVAVWPILWYWASLAGGRWSGSLLWLVLAAGWSAVLILAARRDSFTRRPALSGQTLLIYLLLAVLLVASVASRFVAVRDLAFPPWVDSSRHGLITAVMVDGGRTPTGYEPYLPIDRFPYHFGAHTLAASLVLMTGRTIPDVLLYLGQLLNGLLPLTVYSAAWMITRRRAVGLLAAFLVALPFFFPGYYATWGRLTQLAAMFLMPVLLALTWRLGRGWPRLWPFIGLLAAGLFLIHFRVFLFYVPFAAWIGVTQLAGRRNFRPLAGAAALALALVAPRLVQLLQTTDPLQAAQQSLPGYNDFPSGYVTTGWERLYLALAAVALGAIVVGVVQRRRWVAFPLALLAWVASLFVLLAGDQLGLPETLVVNLNSMYITLFLPLALFLAIVAGAVWRWLEIVYRHSTSRRASRLSAVAAPLGAGIALGVLTLFGWRQQVNILNSQTVLAMPADLGALAWIDQNLPDNAYIAVNAWQWFGSTWAGSDGGAWITPLTGRSTTTPPIDHIYSPELFAQVRAFNEATSVVESWADPYATARLSEQDITHIFVGQRGGYFDPAELSRNPSLTRIYGHDGVFVFAIDR